MTEPDPPFAPPTDPPAAAGSEIATVTSMKLPPFWPSDPELWFAQVEAQFACRRVTSQQTRFDHVVASLSPEFATEVRDLLIKPPADCPYDVLREQLTRRTAASEQRRLQQLFTTEELGDRKPSQLLRKMQQLMGDRPGMTDSSFLKELFLQRLPHNVRIVLASTPDATSLEMLAEMADKIMEVAAPSIATVTPASTPSPLAAEVEHLRAEVTRLEALIRKLTARPHSTSRSRQSRRPPSPAPSTSDSTPALCWYHQKFGGRAQRCSSPCAWGLNEQADH